MYSGAINHSYGYWILIAVGVLDSSGVFPKFQLGSVKWAESSAVFPRSNECMVASSLQYFNPS